MAEVAPFVSTINGVKNIIIYGFELKAASDEAWNVVKMLEMVQTSLNFVKSEASQMWDELDEVEQSGILNHISTANEVILKIATPVAASFHDIRKYGTVTLYRRIRWTLSDKGTASANLHPLQMLNQNLCQMQNRLLSRRIQLQLSAAQIVSIPHLTTESLKMDKKLTPADLGDAGFWRNFSSGSMTASAHSVPKLRISPAADADDSGVVFPMASQASSSLEDITRLAQKPRGPKRGKDRHKYRDGPSSDEIQSRKTKRKKISSTPSPTLWDEILQRDRENELMRRSPSQGHEYAMGTDIYHEINVREQDERKRCRQR